MSAILLSEGLVDRQASIYGSGLGNPPDTVRLFASVSGGLDILSVLADFVELGPDRGYTEQTVSAVDWTFTPDLAAGQVNAQGIWTWIFPAGAALNIYGWYMLNAAVGRVQVAEVFAGGPLVMLAGGDVLILDINDVYHLCP
jgi:hypothetical protein